MGGCRISALVICLFSLLGSPDPRNGGSPVTAAQRRLTLALSLQRSGKPSSSERSGGSCCTTRRGWCGTCSPGFSAPSLGISWKRTHRTGMAGRLLHLPSGSHYSDLRIHDKWQQRLRIQIPGTLWRPSFKDLQMNCSGGRLFIHRTLELPVLPAGQRAREPHFHSCVVGQPEPPSVPSLPLGGHHLGSILL